MLNTGGPVCSGHVARSSKEVPFLLEQGACPKIAAAASELEPA